MIPSGHLLHHVAQRHHQRFLAGCKYRIEFMYFPLTQIQADTNQTNTYYFSTHGCGSLLRSAVLCLPEDVVGLLLPILPVFKNACIFMPVLPVYFWFPVRFTVEYINMNDLAGAQHAVVPTILMSLTVKWQCRLLDIMFMWCSINVSANVYHAHICTIKFMAWNNILV